MAQRSSTTAFAKSTRPEITSVVEREALFTRLDGTPARTLAWICAPAGFGKTTLAASYLQARSYRWAWYQVDADDDDGQTFVHYLTHAMRKLRSADSDLPAFGPEHRANLAAFARRFFRALFAGVQGPVALVLDNLHELRSDSPLRTLLDAGLPQVPRQCCVIVTSRWPAPVSLARLQPGGAMVSLAADDLRLAMPDLQVLARLRGCALTQDALEQLQQRAHGWAAALVLMIEHHKLVQTHSGGSAEAAPQAVFDYMAGEIFEQFDSPTQLLLLHLACLPRVTIDVARALSGDEAAGRILFNLAHNDYFVREVVGPDGRVFVFHPLLRDFLQHRAARDLPQAVGTSALRRAAALLRESGQVEDAVGLLIECKDWPEVAAVALQQADTLLAQGRQATLAAWLESLPPALRAGRPDLQMAWGQALVHISPRQATRCFEQAFLAYQTAGDSAAMLHCCTAAIDAVLKEFDDLTALDRWLAEHDRLRALAQDDANPSVRVRVARLWRQPAHRSVVQQLHRRDAQVSAPLEQVRSTAAWLAGDFGRALAIAKDIEGLGGTTGIALAMSEALRCLVSGDAPAAQQALQRGLAMGEAEAIHGADPWLRLLRAAAALAQQDATLASAELDAVEQLPLRRGDRAFVHYLQAGLAHLKQERGTALREARHAAQVAGEAGLPWLECLARMAMAQCLSAESDTAAAQAQLRTAQALAQDLGSALLQAATHFLQAALALHGAEEDAAVAALQSGFALARDLGLQHVVALPSDVLGQLCALALRRGVAVEQARLMVSAGRLPPPPLALRLRRWPWAFEVSTLGGFALLRAGATIEFSAKGPGRPVELLKVLVSLGGQNVRADVLADALWPHVDADYAHKSFTATLHRLRRIFGGDDALRLTDGRLSLNDRQFWLDTWALDHLLGEVDDTLRGDARAGNQRLFALVDEVLLLYKGPFLPDEAEQPAYIARREQLRARLLHTLTRTARRWEENRLTDAAVDCYLRCIDADELCEAFYRNLMLCYQRHGNVSEAMATYARLHAVLAARLKSQPSPETQAIRASLLT